MTTRGLHIQPSRPIWVAAGLPQCAGVQRSSALVLAQVPGAWQGQGWEQCRAPLGLVAFLVACIGTCHGSLLRREPMAGGRGVVSVLIPVGHQWQEKARAQSGLQSEHVVPCGAFDDTQKCARGTLFREGSISQRSLGIAAHLEPTYLPHASSLYPGLQTLSYYSRPASPFPPKQWHRPS